MNRIKSMQDLRRIVKANPHIRITGAEVPPEKAKRVRKPRLSVDRVVGRITTGQITHLTILLPIRVESEMNARHHWRTVKDRKAAQREEVTIEWSRLFPGFKVELPCAVKLTRIGPVRMDDDNNTISMKFVRDAIAGIIGVDDGSPMVQWEYDQIIDGRYGYGVRIEIMRPFELVEKKS